jgi:VanZ family protein
MAHRVKKAMERCYVFEYDRRNPTPITFPMAKTTVKYLNTVLLLLFLLWLGAIIFFSLVNFRDYLAPEISSAIDDGFYLHILGYFTGSVLGWAAFRNRGWKALLFVGLGLILFGAVLEATHYFIPARTFNPYDIVGNVLGVVLFYLFLIVFIVLKAFGGKRSWR